MKPLPFENRSDRTRAALLHAFRDLIFRDGFENISVQRIVVQAGTARSTFYEHFSGKEDVLRASMAPFFEVMADCVPSTKPPDRLGSVLAHMWENRRLGDAVFSGAPRKILAQSFGELVEARLHRHFGGHPLIIPYRLAAIQLAEAQLALVENWLRGRAFASVEGMTEALYRTSRATAESLRRLD